MELGDGVKSGNKATKIVQDMRFGPKTGPKVEGFEDMWEHLFRSIEIGQKGRRFIPYVL